MTKDKLDLFIFIDALGWELVKRHPGFLKDVMPHRKSLRTILGYSSACDPSIISGLRPSEHRLWSSFYYSPETSPFRWTRCLRFLPPIITKSQRVRNRLSRFIAWVNRFTGYFQIYQVPFSYLPYFDYAEKETIWGENGLEHGETIFQKLACGELPYHVDESSRTDGEKLQRLRQCIKDKSATFAYVLLGKLDAEMHALGTRHEKVSALLAWYDREIRETIKIARRHYSEVAVYVFSDHGMHDVTESHDLIQEVEDLGFEFGKDYVAMYDSTMARFWLFHDAVREAVRQRLQSLDYGEILTDDKLQAEGCYFPDRQYGELIFLVKPGALIVPSFMGRKAIPGMHGYDPNDPDSAACILSNRPLPEDLKSIEQIYALFPKAGTIEGSPQGVSPISR